MYGRQLLRDIRYIEVTRRGHYTDLPNEYQYDPSSTLYLGQRTMVLSEEGVKYQIKAMFIPGILKPRVRVDPTACVSEPTSRSRKDCQFI